MTAYSNQAEWTQDDFDGMSWHDNEVRAVRLRNPAEGYVYDLVLEIDYILEWLPTGKGSFRFLVAPATLTFTDVNHLCVDVELSYKESLTIDSVEREEIATPAQTEAGVRMSRWHIRLHSLGGRVNKIIFDSPGFKQVLTGPPVATDRQALGDDSQT